jgi:hypothetical protein
MPWLIFDKRQYEQLRTPLLQLPIEHPRTYMWHSDILLSRISRVNSGMQKEMRRTIERSAHPKNQGSSRGLLTLAIPAVSAKIAAARVFELAVALGADADHVGHDGARDGALLRVGLRGVFAHGAR